jgi:hypothetical protein
MQKWQNFTNSRTMIKWNKILNDMSHKSWRWNVKICKLIVKGLRNRKKSQILTPRADIEYQFNQTYFRAIWNSQSQPWGLFIVKVLWNHTAFSSRIMIKIWFQIRRDFTHSSANNVALYSVDTFIIELDIILGTFAYKQHYNSIFWRKLYAIILQVVMKCHFILCTT